MKFEATFSERGRVMTRTYDKPDATKEDVIEWVDELKDCINILIDRLNETIEEAESAAGDKSYYIATIKIEWEE